MQPRFVALDISAVPEPETYAMLLGGLALVGFARRRASRA
nr:PEP-CTERM sorting domain-containing protein [Duganella callida]